MLHITNKDSLPKGDYVTAEEALLDDEWEIRSRCESVHEVVSKNILPIREAINAYGITTEQFVGFMLMKNLQTKFAFDDYTIKILLASLLNMVDFANSPLNENSKRIVADMQQLSAVK